MVKPIILSPRITVPATTTTFRPAWAYLPLISMLSTASSAFLEQAIAVRVMVYNPASIFPFNRTNALLLGAHQIGNTALESTAIGNITQTPQNNVLLRIVDWVENGKAPETITGTKFVNDDPTQGVAFVRDHCKYPARNVYVGPGNYTLLESWKCVEDSF